MDRSKIDSRWPTALRWFLSQNLNILTPWHLIQNSSECEFAANAFCREDIHNGQVFVFARRQDRDDFAGLEIVDGTITDKVVYFHPVFANPPLDKAQGNQWNIVCGVFEDVFEFVAKQVIPDMKDWAEDESE